jgi:hypothetical protein
MVMSPSSAKPVLILSFDFGLTSLKPSLCRNWKIDYLPPYFARSVSCSYDKVEIKCMGSVGGKTSTEPKLYYSSLSLGTLNKMKLMLCALFNCYMGDKTKRLSINIAFKYIWQKN